MPRDSRSGAGPRHAATPRPDAAGAAPRAGSPTSAAHPLLALQRTTGNRAAGALVARHGAAALEGEAEREARHALTPRPAAPIPSPHPAPASPRRGGRPGGHPLPPDAREHFERHFGHDLRSVRVHADGRASASARAAGALAFTRGSDIVFRAGRYAPATPSGRHLLAHELAHVVQQREGRAGAVLQRYEGPEHQDLGDRHLGELLAFLETDEGRDWATSIGEDAARLTREIRADPFHGGATLGLDPQYTADGTGTDRARITPGQAIALMGDFYGSVEALAGAPPREVRELIAVIEQQRAGTIAHTAADAEFERITGGRYLRLASGNTNHFARQNRAEWRRLHEEALREARIAGAEGDEARFERALLRDAAAGHFLTDAYASGHLFDYQRVMAAISHHLAQRPIRAANPEMQSYIGIVELAGRLPQLVLKNIHDRMNQEGFEVRNARGMRWRTFGDDHLDAAVETQRVAALAVFLSRRQVNAARGGATPDPAEVESLMPDDDSVERATRLAISYIPVAADGVASLIYRNRTIAPSQFGPVIGRIVESNLSAIGHPGRERELIRLQETEQRLRSGPLVAPSFTILEF